MEQRVTHLHRTSLVNSPYILLLTDAQPMKVPISYPPPQEVLSGSQLQLHFISLAIILLSSYAITLQSVTEGICCPVQLMYRKRDLDRTESWTCNKNGQYICIRITDVDLLFKAIHLSYTWCFITLKLQALPNKQVASLSLVVLHDGITSDRSIPPSWIAILNGIST